MSDPLGRGWDLFGTIDHTIDYQLAQGEWIRWAQMGALLATHVATVVLAHDGAIARVGRRQGLRTTWGVAVAAARVDRGGCDAGRRMNARLALLVAHQGGWDEMLFVLVPIALFAGLLALANRRAMRDQLERETNVPAADVDGAPEGSPPSAPD